MEAESSKKGNSKMAFHIDLNEAPLPSPRDRPPNDAFALSVHVCSVCRRRVPDGRRVDVVTEEQRREFKCFHCLLKSSGVKEVEGGQRWFDINASPPREGESDDVAVAIGARRGAFGGGKTAASTQIALTSYHFTKRNLLPDNLPKTSSLATDLSSSGFQSMLRQMHSDGSFGIFYNKSSSDGGIQPNSTSSANAPQSPNAVYLNFLREYIAERNGFLGEGWHVEFTFCDKTYKTSAVYISPDGNRLKSMEDVARHLGLSSSYHHMETENRIGGVSLLKNGLTFDPANKGFTSNLMAQNCGQRQSIIRGCNSGMKEIAIQENCRVDGIHSALPVQFQDFCLISAGNVDARPSYHNTSQIFPVGYRCSWHDRITGSLFVCDVADGGGSGPIFKVHRYPCSKQSIPVGATILAMKKVGSGKGDGRVGKDDSNAFQVVDDDSISVITLLNESSPPCLDVTLSKREDEVDKSPDYNSSDLDVKCLIQRNGNLVGDIIVLNDVEFHVESRSSSSAWEKASQALLYDCHEKFKQNGAIKFFCEHDIYGINDEILDSIDSLSRYAYSHGPFDIPPLVQNDDLFKLTCEKLHTWLSHDRFGLDADFVQEIIEQLPGVTACLEYKSLNLRKNTEALQTISNGFFQTEWRTSDAFGSCKKSQLQPCDKAEIFKRDHCPPGKSLNSRLPSNLIGDVLQVWELAYRFLDVLGLGEPFSFQELESELMGPWFGSCTNETMDIEDVVLSKREKDPEAKVASHDTHTGLLLTTILGSLLKLLMSELLSKVAVYACPNLDAGEFKSRRSKKKDVNCLAALKKTKLDMLPVNELTWQENARRYILAVLSMEGNLDSLEIASRESRKVFHCLQGDGGLLCGSLTGIAALQGDALVLADAMKDIFGSSKNKNDIVSICERQSDAHGDQTIESNDDVTPEWVQVLEPVRKLPTNVGARIRRCIHEALEKNPPEWAIKMLEHSISKEVYKGNASGPTKRAVIAVLEKVSSENPQLKAETEKKEKVKIKTNVTELISKQCRIVLRCAAAADEDRVFCNLLGKSTLNRNDKDDEGLLGNPAMVSCPLDFRTIDLRLAAGVYDGLHEAFLDDVREVWCNIRTVYSDRSDLIDVAENLSQTFEDLYEKEVQTFVNKIVEASSDDIERDELLAHVAKSLIPRAPWEEGICKACGMDRDDDNVLLCDKCDSEYHRYCLNPPLLEIPEGNWYCPSCVAGQSIPSVAVYGFLENQNKKKRYQGDFVRKFLEALSRLVKLMDVKEFSEFAVEEKTFFLKFFFDEVLNTAVIHEHLEQCAFRATELQQRLRLLTSEMKILKFKEEMLGFSSDREIPNVYKRRAELQSDASSSLPITQPCWPPSQSNNSANMTEELSQGQNQPLVWDHIQQDNIFAHAPLLRRSVTEHAAPSGSVNDSRGPDIVTSEDDILRMRMIKTEISEMQKAIASVEQELVKVSLRKDFLGRDSNGRVYWAFHSHCARPWIIANGSLSSNEKYPEEFVSIPDSDKWMSYESDKEIEELFRWLRDDNVREKELRESILQLQSNKLKDSEYTERHILGREEVDQLSLSSRVNASLAGCLSTKARMELERKSIETESDGRENLASGAKISSRISRCQCLEPLWHSRAHCLSCHQTFLNDEQLRHHSTDCKPVASVSKKSRPIEDLSSRMRSRIVGSLEKDHGTTGTLQPTNNQNERSIFVKHHIEPDCPFKVEEIMARFIVSDPLKDAANGIGLLGSGGLPSFLQSGHSYFSDPALMLRTRRINEADSAERPSNSRSWLQQSDEATAVGLINKSYKLPGCAENRLHVEGPSVSSRMRERDQVSSLGDKSNFFWLTRSNIKSESSSRPLEGRSSEILRFLKINLLDMDAALPEDALRPSRLHQDRRCAWRAFVKSAASIYEMVEATLILEDAIKSNFLSNSWWYWSSPSTAAKISTISALSLRIYALDSAISYEKPLPSGASEEQNSAGPSSSPPLQKTPESDHAENRRTRSRSSKRRKDMNG